MDIEKSIQLVQKYKPVMDGFVRARNPYELKYFVIGRHDDRIQQYKQLLVEMDAKYRAIEEAQHGIDLKRIEKEEKLLQLIESPEIGKEQLFNKKIQLEIVKIEREEKYSYLAMVGALAECRDFALMLETDFKDLLDKSENDLLEYEKEYWVSRLTKQCQVDILSNGKVSGGNLDVLLKLPQEDQIKIIEKSLKNVNEYKDFFGNIEKKIQLENTSSNPQLLTQFKNGYLPLKLLKDAPAGYPGNKIVNLDICEIMIATIHRPEDKEWVSSRFYVPAGKNHIVCEDICPHEMLIGEYKSRMVLNALSLGCTHLFIVDDDIVADDSVLQRLHNHNLDIVGGWYLKKTPVKESATLSRDGESKKPVPLDAEGLLEIDWSLTAGLTLYKVDIFKNMEYPYFHTSDKGTEDTYFTQKAIKYGYKSYLDTSIKAGHLDKKTRIIYTF